MTVRSLPITCATCAKGNPVSCASDRQVCASCVPVCATCSFYVLRKLQTRFAQVIETPKSITCASCAKLPYRFAHLVQDAQPCLSLAQVIGLGLRNLMNSCATCMLICASCVKLVFLYGFMQVHSVPATASRPPNTVVEILARLQNH